VHEVSDAQQFGKLIQIEPASTQKYPNTKRIHYRSTSWMLWLTLPTEYYNLGGGRK